MTEDKAHKSTVPTTTAENAILSVRGLKTRFKTRKGTVTAVEDINFDLKKDELLAVVGESGCGKSVTSLSIMRLIDEPPGKVTAESIMYKGTNLLDLSQEEMQKIRGSQISMIFQEPMNSLTPVIPIGKQISEVIQQHQKVSYKEARKRAVDMIKTVHIPEAEKRMYQYPHQISGGMCQRIMIATALACQPSILIADEPTTALDVTIQAQILKLIKELQQKFNTAVIFITHDMAVVAEIADRVLVMYGGRRVEEARVEDIFENPLHPYTRGLLGAIPTLGSLTGGPRRERLTEIPGIVPSPFNLPKGCYYSERCKYSTEKCEKEFPPFEEKKPGHWAACWLSEDIEGDKVGLTNGE